MGAAPMGLAIATGTWNISLIRRRSLRPPARARARLLSAARRQRQQSDSPRLRSEPRPLAVCARPDSLTGRWYATRQPQRQQQQQHPLTRLPASHTAGKSQRRETRAGPLVPRPTSSSGSGPPRTQLRPLRETRKQATAQTNSHSMPKDYGVVVPMPTGS